MKHGRETNHVLMGSEFSGVRLLYTYMYLRMREKIGVQILKMLDMAEPPKVIDCMILRYSLAETSFSMKNDVASGISFTLKVNHGHLFILSAQMSIQRQMNCLYLRSQRQRRSLCQHHCSLSLQRQKSHVYQQYDVLSILGNRLISMVSGATCLMSES